MTGSSKLEQNVFEQVNSTTIWTKLFQCVDVHLRAILERPESVSELKCATKIPLVPNLCEEEFDSVGRPRSV